MNREQFIKDRHEAFKSMDKKKLEAYLRKYEIGMYEVKLPRDERIWKGGIHKAILECNDFSDDEKRESVIWLLLNGYQQDGLGNPLWERFGYLMPGPEYDQE